MFFCDKCRYLYNVTKDIKAKQIGGKISDSIENLFQKFHKGESLDESDLKRIVGKDVTDSDHFENMTKKDQRKLISWIKSVNKSFFEEDEDSEEKVGVSIAYFICKYCKNYEPIKPGTLIYSKKYGSESSTEAEDYTYAIYDQTLARTRNYVCKNPSCESHENLDLREAALTKNNMDQIVYVCTTCTTHWVNTV